VVACEQDTTAFVWKYPAALPLPSASEILIFKISDQWRFYLMAEKKLYIIKIQGVLVEVTEEVYRTYYAMERHTKTLDEKDKRNGLASYHAMDSGEVSGEEAIPDLDTDSVETQTINLLLQEKLRQYITLLPDTDQNLLHALYFEALSERQLAERTGIPQKTINDRKWAAIGRLRKMFNFSKKFRSKGI
jgi:RNA polymerase sigma factor (sigma-70 family)